MPIYEFICKKGHRTTQFFKTFSEAEPHQDNYQCAACKRKAARIVSVPLKAHFYGSPEGWSKPSPTKRYSTKLVSQKDGNNSAVG